MKIDYTKYHRYAIKIYGLKTISLWASATIFTNFKEKLFEKVTGKPMSYWFKMYGLNTHAAMIEEISEKYNILALTNGDVFYLLIPKENEELNSWFRGAVTMPFKELKRLYPYWDRGISNIERKMGLSSGNFSKKSYTELINGSSIVKSSKNDKYRLAELKSVLGDTVLNIWDVENVDMIGRYDTINKTITFTEYFGDRITISKEQLEDLLTLLY